MSSVEDEPDKILSQVFVSRKPTKKLNRAFRTLNKTVNNLARAGEGSFVGSATEQLHQDDNREDSTFKIIHDTLQESDSEDDGDDEGVGPGSGDAGDTTASSVESDDHHGGGTAGTKPVMHHPQALRPATSHPGIRPNPNPPTSHTPARFNTPRQTPRPQSRQTPGPHTSRHSSQARPTSRARPATRASAHSHHPGTSATPDLYSNIVRQAQSQSQQQRKTKQPVLYINDGQGARVTPHPSHPRSRRNSREGGKHADQQYFSFQDDVIREKERKRAREEDELRRNQQWMAYIDTTHDQAEDEVGQLSEEDHDLDHHNHGHGSSSDDKAYSEYDFGPTIAGTAAGVGVGGAATTMSNGNQSSIVSPSHLHQHQIQSTPQHLYQSQPQHHQHQQQQQLPQQQHFFPSFFGQPQQSQQSLHNYQQDLMTSRLNRPAVTVSPGVASSIPSQTIISPSPPRHPIIPGDIGINITPESDGGDSAHSPRSTVTHTESDGLSPGVVGGLGTAGDPSSTTARAQPAPRGLISRTLFEEAEEPSKYSAKALFSKMKKRRQDHPLNVYQQQLGGQDIDPYATGTYSPGMTYQSQSAAAAAAAGQAAVQAAGGGGTQLRSHGSAPALTALQQQQLHQQHIYQQQLQNQHLQQAYARSRGIRVGSVSGQGAGQSRVTFTGSPSVQRSAVAGAQSGAAGALASPPAPSPDEKEEEPGRQMYNYWLSSRDYISNQVSGLFSGWSWAGEGGDQPPVPPGGVPGGAGKSGKGGDKARSSKDRSRPKQNYRMPSSFVQPTIIAARDEEPSDYDAKSIMDASPPNSPESNKLSRASRPVPGPIPGTVLASAAGTGPAGTVVAGGPGGAPMASGAMVEGETKAQRRMRKTMKFFFQRPPNQRRRTLPQLMPPGSGPIPGSSGESVMDLSDRRTIAPTIFDGEVPAPAGAGAPIYSHFVNVFRSWARFSVVLKPIDAVADMVPSLQNVVVVVELFVLMWILYQVSIIVQTIATVVRTVCMPVIVICRALGITGSKR